MINIENREIDIVQLGKSTEKDGVYKRLVTFETEEKTFDLEIVLGPNGTGDDFEEPAAFYARNKDEVDAALQLYFSKTETESKS